MKIIIIGGAGTVGKAIVTELKGRHSILIAGRAHGDLVVDITNPASIEAMYQKSGPVDAVIVAAGEVHFGPLAEMTVSDYELGLKNKLMGQVNVVLIGRKHVNPQGSFTLTSGILNHDPIVYGSSAAMVNGALEGFVKSAAIELPQAQRINVVSPTVLVEAMENYAPYFRGFRPVSAAEVALAYSKSVEGAQTGQVYRVG